MKVIEDMLRIQEERRQGPESCGDEGDYDVPDVKDGGELIAHERQRQKVSKGYSSEHDDEHTNFELSKAASTRLQSLWWGDLGGRGDQESILILVKAGALIAAEIDRLQRKLAASNPKR